MTVSSPDLPCLNAVMDDHEAVAPILEEVRRTSHGNGLIATYSFDPAGRVPKPAPSAGPARRAPLRQRALLGSHHAQPRARTPYLPAALRLAG